MSLGDLSALQGGLVVAGMLLTALGLWASYKTYHWIPSNVVARRRDLSPYLLSGVVACAGVGLAVYQFVDWPWQRLAVLVIGLAFVLLALLTLRVEFGYSFYRGSRGIMTVALMIMVLGAGMGITTAAFV